MEYLIGITVAFFVAKKANEYYQNSLLKNKDKEALSLRHKIDFRGPISTYVSESNSIPTELFDRNIFLTRKDTTHPLLIPTNHALAVPRIQMRELGYPYV